MTIAIKLNHHKYSILTSNNTLHGGKQFLESGSYLIERRFARQTSRRIPASVMSRSNRLGVGGFSGMGGARLWVGVVEPGSSP
ncbi:hypothetical protein E2C01_088952 [Portunus trituberculatus]|uniref:Uncharacterized protein n=1 Tax=Portunus trituberculatus TaxID=210409 RepID=A0A5B7JAP6_PORTR|nr:hypothetical protein [Portunus trituberculatus]